MFARFYRHKGKKKSFIIDHTCQSLIYLKTTTEFDKLYTWVSFLQCLMHKAIPQFTLSWWNPGVHGGGNTWPWREQPHTQSPQILQNWKQYVSSKNFVHQFFYNNLIIYLWKFNLFEITNISQFSSNIKCTFYMGLLEKKIDFFC